MTSPVNEHGVSATFATQGELYETVAVETESRIQVDSVIIKKLSQVDERLVEADSRSISTLEQFREFRDAVNRALIGLAVGEVGIVIGLVMALWKAAG